MGTGLHFSPTPSGQNIAFAWVYTRQLCMFSTYIWEQKGCKVHLSTPASKTQQGYLEYAVAFAASSPWPSPAPSLLGSLSVPSSLSLPHPHYVSPLAGQLVTATGISNLCPSSPSREKIHFCSFVLRHNCLQGWWQGEGGFKVQNDLSRV